MTNAKLQEYMQNTIKGGTLNADALHFVNISMARIWKEARQQLPTPASAPDAVTEVAWPHPRACLNLFY
jgi:hypothetical protein